MVNIVRHSPWAYQVEAVGTIAKFVKDLTAGRHIPLSQVLDVGCAVNSLLPSARSLGKFLTKSKWAKKHAIAAGKRTARNLKRGGMRGIKRGAKRVGSAMLRKAKKEAKKLPGRAKRFVKGELKALVKDLKKELKANVAYMIEESNPFP